MAFAFRTRNKHFELNPGETVSWFLPPMTEGLIDISSFYASIRGGMAESETELDSGGHSATFRSGHLTTSSGRTGGEFGSTDGTIERDQPQPPTVVNGSTLELQLELLRGGQVIGEHSNHIIHQNLNAGDIFSLRVTRNQDGSIEGRRYKFVVQYCSVLPIETRRIPLGFFERGFKKNWNDNPYLDYVSIKDNLLSYRWRSDFARLYKKTMEDVYIQLGPEGLKFPQIRNIRITVSAKADINPFLTPPSEPNTIPYFILRIDGEYVGTRDVEFELPLLPNPSKTLPDPVYFEARFYLVTGPLGTIAYNVKVSSPLLDQLDFDIKYPTLSGAVETINLKDKVTDALEGHLYRLQFGETGNGFDKYLRPYLVGRFEVLNIGYDRDKDEILIDYVGRQRPLNLTGAAGWNELEADRFPEIPVSEPPPEDLRMFDTPEELLIRGDGWGVDPALIRDVDPGALSKIEHIVVLMQENRSFDQILGYLSRDGMLPREDLFAVQETELREPKQVDVDGLKPGDNDRDMNKFPDDNSGHVYRSNRTKTTAWPSFDLENPAHGHDSVERQISDNMKGFVADYARSRGNNRDELQLIMNYLTDAELPAFGLLTREFAICDRWFCSHIGGTLPNRFISLTGDLSEDIYGSPEVENPDLADGFAPLEATSFFDHLSTRGVSWKLYEHGYSMLRLMRNHTFDETNIVPFESISEGFATAARNGTLPSVSFIEPNYIEAPGGNDDHAPADMLDGQRLIAKIVDALLSSKPGIWEKTMLIITYDEHGGFYDHVPLPFEIESTVNGNTMRRPIPPLANGERRLGVRVPTFVISPLIKPMSNGKVNVSHSIFDHTTIPATILRRFCGPRPPFMGARMAEAADLRDLIELDTARLRSDFNKLAQEMRDIADRPAAGQGGVTPAAPLRVPKNGRLEDDFHDLLAFASSVTGVGPSS